MRSGTIAFLLGILAAMQLQNLPAPAWLLAGIPLVIGLFFYPRWRIPIAFTLGFLWLVLRASLILSTGLPLKLEGRTLTVEGRVVGLPVERQDSIRFLFEPDRLEAAGQSWPSPGRLQVSWYYPRERLVPGEIWRLQLRLKRPYGFRNPGGFDYEGWLFQQRIRATGYVTKSKQNLRLSPPQGEWIQRVRQELLRQFNRHLTDTPWRGLLIALTMGEQQGISREQWQVLTRTGTSHLIAVSGQHISLIAGLAFFLGRWLWARFGNAPLYLAAPRFGAIAAWLAAAGYTAIAGFAIPAERSLLMVTVLMLGVFTHRKIAAFDLLLLALLLVLIRDPLAVMAAGFWLSFVSVAIIFYVITARIKSYGFWWQGIRLHLAVALGLTPLLALLFGQNPLVGPVANLILVPWVSFVVLPLALLGALTLSIPVLGSILLHIAAGCWELSWPLLEKLSEQSFATWEQPVHALGVALAAFIGVVLLLLPRGMPGRWLGLVGLIPLLAYAPERPPPGSFRFTLLDVGQGLAAVIQTREHSLVFDSGPRFSDVFDSGSAVVVPYLRDQGIHFVDAVVISHANLDHSGGLAGILANIPVAKVVSSAPDITREHAVEFCREGQRWYWDGVEFTFLHPGMAGDGRHNNFSCVLHVRAGRQAVLLTGDIEAAAEQRLLHRHGDELMAQILVAPHHGSKTSSSNAFIAAVDPDFVLFPVGYRNRYGFPKPRIRARYRRRTILPLEVDKEGAIEFVLGRAVIEPRAYRRQSRRFWHAV